MSEEPGLPTCCRVIQLHVVPLKRDLCLHIYLSVRIQEPTLALRKLGLTFLEGVCEALRALGEVTGKLLQSTRVLGVGAWLLPSTCRGDLGLAAVHEISGTCSYRPEAMAGPITLQGPGKAS